MQIWVSTNASFRHDPVLKMNKRRENEHAFPSIMLEKANEKCAMSTGPGLSRQAQSGGERKQV